MKETTLLLEKKGWKIISQSDYDEKNKIKEKTALVTCLYSTRQLFV